MVASNIINLDELGHTVNPSASNADHHLHSSGVSWSAVLAGATAAAALSLVLLMLGTGLGLSSISPWANKGVNTSTFGLSAIVWLSITQILASGMGGYLAGRLRVKWIGVHADEVYFRDTAHGFLTWGVATLATAALLTSIISSIVNGGVQAASSLAGGAATATLVMGAATVNSDLSKSDSVIGTDSGLMGYYIDSLFRKDFSRSIDSSDQTQNSTHANNSEAKAPAISEVSLIFKNAMNSTTLPASDLEYISQLVSNHTGLTQPEAQKRVNEIYTNMQTTKIKVELAAKIKAEEVRKSTIYATLWLFVSLLMGAFSASLAATWGGISRDA